MCDIIKYIISVILGYIKYILHIGYIKYILSVISGYIKYILSVISDYIKCYLWYQVTSNMSCGQNIYYCLFQVRQVGSH